MTTNWGMLRKHMDHVAEGGGQWVGLFDANGNWLMDLPVTGLDGRQLLRGIGAGELTIPTVGSWGQLHSVLDALVAPGLGFIAEDGALSPRLKQRALIVVQRGTGRSTYVVGAPRLPVHPTDPPTEVTLPLLDMVSMLEQWPAPSIPHAWQPGFEEWTEDAGGKYTMPRVYAPVEFAENITDGYLIDDTADIAIRRAIQDSFDAVNTLMGWTSDPHLVVDWSAPSPDSERLLIQFKDATVWDTIQQPAAWAGVSITVNMWLPGDPPILARAPGRNEYHETYYPNPVGVVTVTQGAKR